MYSPPMSASQVFVHISMPGFLNKVTYQFYSCVSYQFSNKISSRSDVRCTQWETAWVEYIEISLLQFARKVGLNFLNNCSKEANLLCKSRIFWFPLFWWNLEVPYLPLCNLHRGFMMWKIARWNVIRKCCRENGGKCEYLLCSLHP